MEISSHWKQFHQFGLFRYWLIIPKIVEISKKALTTVLTRAQEISFHVSYVKIEAFILPSKYFQEKKQNINKEIFLS